MHGRKKKLNAQYVAHDCRHFASQAAQKFTRYPIYIREYTWNRRISNRCIEAHAYSKKFNLFKFTLFPSLNVIQFNIFAVPLIISN